MNVCPDLLAVPQRVERRAQPAKLASLATCLLLFAGAPGHAEADALGRLFYTPEQRAQLESARARKITGHDAPARSDAARPAAPVAVPPPTRFDGVVIRSDGTATRWVDGRPEVGPSGVNGLKPGQTRSRGTVYEPYQIVRPQPVPPEDESPSR